MENLTALQAQVVQLSALLTEIRKSATELLPIARESLHIAENMHDDIANALNTKDGEITDNDLENERNAYQLYSNTEDVYNALSDIAERNEKFRQVERFAEDLGEVLGKFGD